MSCFPFGFMSSLCILSSLFGADAEDCVRTVLNRRQSFYVESGESLSLSCVVQHCGDPCTWSWIWKNSTYDTFDSISRTNRRRVTSENVSANRTQLVLDLESVCELDEGYYGCRVEWRSNQVDRGHLMYVNVTAAVSSDWKVQHQILVCFGVSLCLGLVLGLAFCLRARVTPQSLHRRFTPETPPCPVPGPSAEYQAPLHQSTPRPPPDRSAPQKHRACSKKALLPPRQTTEVLYADISQDALQQQRRSKPSEALPTIYSSLRFE